MNFRIMGQKKSKANQVDPQKEREDFVKKCLNCSSFTELSEEGKQEFLDFAERNNAQNYRRLEFWFSVPEDRKIRQLLEPFVVDGEKQLTDVKPTDECDRILRNARSVDVYIGELKERMRGDLVTLFKEFKRALERELS